MPERHAALAPQFDSLEQQHETATLGMWVFLATELMLFGALFTGYTVYRFLYPAGFAEGSHHLDVVLGTINTVVLITSSLTMALAVHGAQLGKRKALLGFLVLTILLGTAFMGIKAIEYTAHYREHLAPGLAFVYGGPNAREVELFFLFYFAMTGVHAIHLTIGIGVLTAVLLLAWRGHYSSEHHSQVELAGLYWHFVDIVWVFLLPLLYLFGRHQ
jgi:cytochrome c oxidase subunit III